MTIQDDMSAMLKRIAERHEVPLAVLLAIVAGVVGTGARPDLAKVEGQLTRRAKDVVALRRRLARPTTDAGVADRRAAAARALEAGQFAEVDRALAQLELQFFGGTADLAAMPDDRRIAAGETRADRGATTILELGARACREAAQRYGEAAAIIGVADIARSRELALAQGNALARMGEDFGDRAGFEGAITHYRALLAGLDNFGDTIPWAAVQERLGLAMAGLAGLGGDGAALDQAAACYRTALEDLRREQAPALWTRLQARLGGLMLQLGESRGDTDLLEEATEALRAALSGIDRATEGERWSMAQYDLARALSALGRKITDTAKLEQAFNAFQSLLDTWTRERVPALWAELHDRMGDVLSAMGERYREPVVLEEAIAAFGTALEERKRETSPLLWATSTANQGLASVKLAARRKDPVLAREACTQIATAVEVMREAGHDASAAELQKKLVIAGGMVAGMGKA